MIQRMHYAAPTFIAVRKGIEKTKLYLHWPNNKVELMAERHKCVSQGPVLFQRAYVLPKDMNVV